MKRDTAITLPVTMADLLARCVEVGDCQVWNGSWSSDGRPIWHIRRQQHVSVRRLVLEMRLGRRIQARKYAACTCWTHGCIEHVGELNRAQIIARSKSRGTVGGPAASARARRVAMQQPTKLSHEAAAEIRRRRAEGETLVSLARAFGVHHSLIDRIVKGKAWAPVAGSSVFAPGACV